MQFYTPGGIESKEPIEITLVIRPTYTMNYHMTIRTKMREDDTFL